MNTRAIAALSLAIFLSTPALALASFNDSVQRGQGQVASLTQEQLDSLNTKVFADAYLTAKIIGYDPAEIKQLKADVQLLRQENALLRAQLQASPAAGTAVVSSVSLETRVTKLETSFASLNDTLLLVVNMLRTLLAKL
jgi:hypothetical protein